MRRLSVVIPNYNYEQFVGEAIESALALDWPDVEVVVVDDGSTDQSLEVINRYRDRVTVLPTENATQRVAVNRGFARSTGDVVIILDSDDVLPPGLPGRLAEVWHPGVSKVQFRMQRIDEAGHPRGDAFPRRIAPTPATLRTWFVRTSAYPTPPGSANAYARWFLERLMPLGPETGDFADSALLAAAPLLGDVLSLPDVIVGYRQHANNDSFLLSDPTRFAREVRRAEARWGLACAVAPTALSRTALFRSRELLQFRVAAFVSCADGQRLEIDGDGRGRMAVNAALSPIWPGPESARLRVAIAAWSLLTVLAPRSLARRLVTWRYSRVRT